MFLLKHKLNILIDKFGHEGDDNHYQIVFTGKCSVCNEQHRNKAKPGCKINMKCILLIQNNQLSPL